MNLFRIFIIAGLSVGAIFALSAAQRGDAKSDVVGYELLSRDGDVEIRNYAPRLVAEVEMESLDERSMNNAFRTLAAFIFGENQPRSKIAMTAPVTAESAKIAMTAPVTSETVGANSKNGSSERAHIMRFFMPSEFSLETLPVPTDKRIRIFELPARKVAAIRFSGSAKAANFEKHERQLQEAVSKNHLKVVGSPYRAYYNPPFTPPFLKRNEVMVELGTVDE